MGEAPPSGAMAVSTWVKLAVVALAVQLASVGIIAALTWVIVQHHKEVNVLGGVLVAQGDPRARAVATAAAMHEWDLEHVRLLTVEQLRALRSVSVPLNATTKVYSVSGVEVNTPDGSLEHARVTLFTHAGDTLHVEESPDAAPTGTTLSFHGTGLTAPPLAARVRTCTGVTAASYPLSSGGGARTVSCPSSLLLTDRTGAQLREALSQSPVSVARLSRRALQTTSRGVSPVFSASLGPQPLPDEFMETHTEPADSPSSPDDLDPCQGLYETCR